MLMVCGNESSLGLFYLLLTAIMNTNFQLDEGVEKLWIETIVASISGKSIETGGSHCGIHALTTLSDELGSEGDCTQVSHKC